MTSANRTLIVLLLAVAGGLVFWFLLLSPKKDEIALLDEQIAQLHSSIADSQQAAAVGRQAKENFKSDYAQLVTMGKAVPDGDEQAALLVQLNRLGLRNDTFFSSITMESSGTSAPPPSSSAPQSGDAAVEPSATAPAGESPDPATTVAATEASVATVPLGAEVGPAGLGVIPYNLLYRGNFFKIADFISSINGLIGTNSDGQVKVNGRLMTINGFSLNPADDSGNLASLTGNFSITTFVTPTSQGLLAGATPAGPGTGGENAPVLTGSQP